MAKDKHVITSDHLYLLTYYITVMSSEYALSNVVGGSTNVRDMKRKTNQYADFLDSHVHKLFKEAYEIEESQMERLYNNLQARVNFQVEELIKDMCNL